MRTTLAILGILVIGIAGYFSLERSSQDSTMSFQASSELQTDFTKTEIDTALLLSGGPGKDGIPALTEPSFVSVERAKLADDVEGVLVIRGDDQRFYPYTILVWHEIVNDVVGEVPLAITFCPLCGSAIVFNRVVGDKVLEFGVSGLLYESNLVMYDRSTETLWSQALGRAVVGDLVGTELTIEPMSVVPFRAVREKYPGARVLSEETGHRRDYTLYPYGDYDNTEELFFPVSVSDTRFPAKERMYVVPFQGRSYALPLHTITEGEVSVRAPDGTVFVVQQDVHGEIAVSTADKKQLPGYYEMWFSWATHHQDDGVVLR